MEKKVSKVRWRTATIVLLRMGQSLYCIETDERPGICTPVHNCTLVKDG